MNLSLKYIVCLLSLIHLCVGDPSSWTINVPSVGQLQDNVLVRVMIDGVEQTSGTVAAFNPDGYITSIENSGASIPAGPHSGKFVFGMAISGDANGELHTLHYSPDGVEDITLTPQHTFQDGNSAVTEYSGTSAAATTAAPTTAAATTVAPTTAAATTATPCSATVLATVGGVDYYLEHYDGLPDGSVDESTCSNLATQLGVSYNTMNANGVPEGCWASYVYGNNHGFRYNSGTSSVKCNNHHAPGGSTAACVQSSCPVNDVNPSTATTPAPPTQAPTTTPAPTQAPTQAPITYELVSSGPPNEARLLNEAECEAYANSRDPVASFTVHASGNVLGCTVNTDSNSVKYTASSSSNSNCNFGGDKCVYNALIDNAIVLSSAANVDLLTLKRCDSTANSIDSIDDTNQNYGMVHSIGLTYQRSSLEAGRDPITYCQDQEFALTIARDASATTSVTTLVAPSLQRSVVVHGISWVQCESQLLECAGSSDCYKLQIDLSAKEKNVDDTVWVNASLSDAFQHEGGENTDSMTVVHDLSPTSTGNIISLVGQCGIIQDCSLSNPGANNHWYEHTSTEQDVVLRGTFQFVDVDSIAKISTAFSKCPLGATTTYNGELKLGLSLQCEDRLGNDVALTKIDSDVTDANGVVQNCRSALTSSLVRLTTDVYVNTKDPAGKEAAEGWEMKDIDFKFNRYEASLTGEPIKSKLVSSDLIMQMRYDSGTGDWTCTRISSRITGLPLFDQAVLDCDISDLTTTTDSSSKTGLTHGEAGTIMFDLQPLQMANMDAYEVEVIAMIQNLQLESRRLRTSYTLKSGGLVNQAAGFPTVSGNVTVGDSGERDEERNDHLETVITILVVIAVLLGLIAGGLFMCCRRRGTDMTSANLATVEEKQSLVHKPIEGMKLRSGRKNLRY